MTGTYYNVQSQKARNMATETGFPSPARGYEETNIDLNRLLVHNPPATFFMRMKGSRLVYRGILPDDLLVVDRSRPPAPGCLVVYREDADFVCRELRREGNGYALADGTGASRAVCVDTEIFGTITGVVRKL
jgi:DNA polymerase V